MQMIIINRFYSVSNNVLLSYFKVPVIFHISISKLYQCTFDKGTLTFR